MKTEKQRERLVELLDNLPNGELLTKDVADYLIKNGCKLAVMCCECKYCETVLNIIDEPKLFCTRLVGSIPVDFTDYCSYGKVRENVKFDRKECEGV